MNNLGLLMQAVNNPQQFLQNAMQNTQFMQNPIFKNTVDMIKKGDDKGLEEMARNLCAEKGINPEDAIKQIKTQFGM